MAEDSLIRRFGYKLGGNFLGLPINFAIQWCVARGLGPASYGRLAYLTGFFNDLIGLFDAGTSTAFYTKLCARQSDRGLISFYWRLVLSIVFIISIIVPLVASDSQLRNTLWPEANAPSIFVAALAGLAIWVVNIAGKVVDAFGLTADAEIARVGQRVISVLGFAGLYLLGWLSLPAVFVLQIVFAIAQICLWEVTARRSGHSLFERGRMSRAAFVSYAREFWSYSHPLLSYAILVMAGGLADRWLLQRFAGSVQQGFYGLSVQVGSFCFLFTSAMVPLLARDFAQSIESKDLARIRRNFGKASNILFCIAAVIAIGIAFQAENVARLVGGNAFSQAGIPVAIMCLYPVYQTYGQINISLFYATSRTQLHRNLGLINITVGLIVSYCVLAPKADGGFALGSVGLAAKMVAIQFAAVNLQLWFNTRRLGLGYFRFVLQQFVTLGTLGIIALIAGGIVHRFNPPLALDVAACTALYALAVTVVLWRMPQLLAISAEDRRSYANHIYYWYQRSRVPSCS